MYVFIVGEWLVQVYCHPPTSGSYELDRAGWESWLYQASFGQLDVRLAELPEYFSEERSREAAELVVKAERAGMRLLVLEEY